MTSIEEALSGQDTPLAAALATGVETLALNQKITFTKYIKLVLPLDGFVFWVKADLVSTAALYNAAQFNEVPFNTGPVVITPAPTFEASGSLHYMTDTRQEETETYGMNKVIFTSLKEVTDLNQVGPNVLMIGEFQGLKFAFSTRRSFYQQAELHHYVGDAVYSDMQTQLVDSIDGFNSRDVIVSNSLPLWLSMNGFIAPEYEVFGNPTLVLYPSFLLPNNLVPPYGSVHIPPESTQAIQGAPEFNVKMSHAQLVQERVKITMYGMRNFNALDFVDFVSQYSLSSDYFGIMNQPVIRDEKRTQSELNTIAMKKTVEFEINYYQRRMNNIARQLIVTAIPSFYVGEQQVA
jgi:hypothetical protein